jgi:AcrR family transcriptional regulator
MDALSKISLQPRKSPAQARSTATVEAIMEATIQVLLVAGPGRLTTTRVAGRAGVSVGTLYQYFPNKHSLLFALMERHLRSVADAVESACQRNHGQPVSLMIESVVQAYVDAKSQRIDVSKALYAVAGSREAAALVKKIEKRGRIALASMLASAPQVQFADLPFTCQMLVAAISGATRAVLEAGPSPKMVAMLRKQLVLLCQGFIMNVAVKPEGEAQR